MNKRNKAILAALTDLSGIGDARARELYMHFDDPEDLLDPPETLIDEFHYVDASTHGELRTLNNDIASYQDRFDGYESNGITVLGIEDDQYPETVRNSPAPALLYAKGNIELLNKTGIGVSGSRETNNEGQRWIKSIAADLVGEGYTVISGGARGADTAAHEGALKRKNSTIAVLGTGVNVAYPPENEPLFTQIVETGGLLLSMRPPDAEPTRHAFIDRNELIAALSDGMVFVATDGSGGTMAQYKLACEHDCPVFVPPSNLNIEPRDGLVTIRNANDTDSIQNTHDILDNLSEPGSEQMDLDDWA